jgi:hypothetical protein
MNYSNCNINQKINSKASRENYGVRFGCRIANPKIMRDVLITDHADHVDHPFHYFEFANKLSS